MDEVLELFNKVYAKQVQNTLKPAGFAKIHTIRNSIKRMKKLADSKARNEKLEKKNSMTLEILKDEFHILKKLKKKEIAQFALTHSQESNQQKINNVNESLRTKVLAKLSMEKSLKPIVQEFHELFPNWRKLWYLNNLKKTISVKAKRERKKLGDTENVIVGDSWEDGASFCAGAEVVEEDDGGKNFSENEENDDFVDEDLGGERSSDEDEQSGKDEGSYHQQSKDNECNVSESHVSDDDVSENKLSENHVSDDDVSENKLSENHVSDDDVSENHVSDENNVKTLESSDIISTPTKRSSTNEQLKEDPFFLKKDNKSYLTRCDVVEDRLLMKSNHHRSLERYNGSNEAGQERKQFPKAQFRYFRDDAKLNTPENESVSTGARANNSVLPAPRIGHRFAERNQTQLENLHPSWAAKKRITAILPPQGKKIKFD